jgi:hypothetical protein
MAKSLRGPLGWLWLALAALPALIPMWMIQHYGVDVHYWDEWGAPIAGFFVKVHQHQATFHDFVAQTNEHRILIPRLFLLFLNQFTQWNNVQTLLAGWGMVCVMSLAILWLIHRTDDSGSQAGISGRTIFLWFLCNILLFTPAQSENWMWGVIVINFMPTLLILLALTCARGNALSVWKLAVCILLASMSTFSSGNGILAWPVVGLVLFWPPQMMSARWKGMLGVWIAACIANVILYRIGYVEPKHGQTLGPDSGPMALLLHRPGDLFLYNLAFMGNLFSQTTDFSSQMLARIVGAIFFAGFLAAIAWLCYAWKKGERELCGRMIVWIAVGFFAIASGFIASLFRAGYGPQQALSPRYVSYSIFLPIGLINLVPLMLNSLRNRWGAPPEGLWAYFPAALATALVMGEALGYPPWINAFRTTSEIRREAKAGLLLINILPDNPDLSFNVSNDPALLETARALNDMGYLHPPLIESSSANLILAKDASGDPVIGQLERMQSPDADHVEVFGWAVHKNAQTPADGMFLTYDDGTGPIIFAPAAVLLPDEELVAKTQNPDYLHCGWAAEFSPSSLPAGKVVEIRAWALDTNTGLAYPLDGSKKVQR